MACLKICPTDAVRGEKKSQHSIKDGLCIECGACGRVCPKSCVLDDNGAPIRKLKKALWPKPAINAPRCLACENCVEVCPVNAMAMAGEQLSQEENYAVLAHPEACISCGWCASSCLFDAICMEGVS